MNIEDFLVAVPTEQEMARLMNLLNHHIKTTKELTDFHSLMLMLPGAATVLFGPDYEKDICYFRKKRQKEFNHPHVLEKAKEIWASGLIPIEVWRTNGFLFYSVPQKEYFDRDLGKIQMLYSEDKIPSLRDFDRYKKLFE